MEILLYGIVGDPCEGLDASTLISAIAAAPDDIIVRINSLGGLVFDGLAIFNALQQSPRRVTAYIDGVAASMASVIAMAADEIIMAENAVMMIHNPVDGTYGDAAELRQTADRLDKIKGQLVAIYAKRTGLDDDTLGAMLDSETWLTSAEALEMKFVDTVAVAQRVAAVCDASKFGFRKVPDHPLIANVAASPALAPAATIKEPTMPDLPEPAAPAPTPVIIQPQAVTDAVAVALAAERLRGSTIRAEVTRAGLDAHFGDTLVNEGVTVEVARERIIDQIATAAPNITNHRPAMIPAAQFAARAEAMSVAILHRANPRNQLTEDARAFAGRRLGTLARDWLEATGVSTRNMGDIEIAQVAMRQPRNATPGLHTTSDFPSLLGNTVGRTLRRAYELAPKTYQAFCRQSSIADFRPVSRVALSDISQMQQIGEAGEYPYLTVGDGAEQFQLSKWGGIIAISWETIVNDDLSAFDRVPMALGQEAAQIESDVVYGILLNNPNMADGFALFDAANHKNLAAATAAISVASLGAGRLAMRTQKAPKGRTLSITPAQLVVGPVNEQLANQFTSANYVATKNVDINPEYNRSLDVTVESRITDDRWFMAADPNAQPIDTIEYAYLSGAEGVMIEQRQGFEVDGVEIKGRLVFGAKAIDYRGLYGVPHS